MKLITTPFLSGLCYGPVHVGVYDPWTFVGQIHLFYLLLLFQPPPLALPCLVPTPWGSVSWVVCLRYFVSLYSFDVGCLAVVGRWVRVLLETLDISVSHSCACTWSAIVIDCACGGRAL